MHNADTNTTQSISIVADVEPRVIVRLTAKVTQSRNSNTTAAEVAVTATLRVADGGDSCRLTTAVKAVAVAPVTEVQTANVTAFWLLVATSQHLPLGYS